MKADLVQWRRNPPLPIYKKLTILQVHKALLSTKPTENHIPPMLFNLRVLPSFKRSMFEVYRELENEKENLRQQVESTTLPVKIVQKATKKLKIQ